MTTKVEREWAIQEIKSNGALRTHEEWSAISTLVETAEDFDTVEAWAKKQLEDPGSAWSMAAKDEWENFFDMFLKALQGDRETLERR